MIGERMLGDVGECSNGWWCGRVGDPGLGARLSSKIRVHTSPIMILKDVLKRSFISTLALTVARGVSYFRLGVRPMRSPG